MPFYELNLAVFAAVNTFLVYRQYRRGGTKEKGDASECRDRADTELLGNWTDADPTALSEFQQEFFLVYGLAVAADWLQGPHIYAIYKYEKDIPEKLVAALYATGFISGGVSASFAGELADRCGRRLACLIYCGSYIVTCMSMLSNNLAVLFVGRLCGGVSTTLLFSVFEAWMITEYHNRGLDGSRLKLSSVFGYMTTLSCIIAIVSGVVGDILVAELGGRMWPFVASIVCCLAAGYLILTTWRENYGSNSPEQNSFGDVKSSIMTIITDKRILSLGVTSCFFEGAMYLFIFFWSAALKSARERRVSSGNGEEAGDLPFGLIFASFMCAMMAGSSFFSLHSGGVHTRESASFILMCCILLVSCCLSGAVLLEDEHLLFWAMCVLEACVGAYFPSMSFLKSEVVDDGVRGRVYSILRFPLNVLVVITHSLDREGDAHRNHVFMSLAAFLILAFFVVKRTFAGE